MIKKAALSLLCAFALFGGSSAEAYPEMVRYGYVNCNSCHVSLTGGGVLNDYGREISREKLALFKSDDEHAKESLFAYGILSETSLQKHIKAGGDLRSVYYYVDDENTRQARTIFMQGDFEAAYVSPKFILDATAGVEQLGAGKNLTFLSRRHYAQYALSEAFNIRGGKFTPAYGINTADHITLTRNPLQLGENFESYNLEFSYITEQWNAFVTGILGRFDNKQSKQDRGFSVQGAYAPTERIKIGANAWYGEQLNQSRWLAGPFGLVSLSPSVIFQSEVDFEWVKPNGALLSRRGVATSQKLSYEALEGLWVYGIQEYGKSNFLSEVSQAESYGLGVQIFPRSHFEFNLAYQRVRQGGGSRNFYDTAFLMSHFYL